ncbi:hypothetical protein L596_014930 [Steinernema carpocapsae]|uniref:Chitin-binding type-2 domain-containing protein n=1 Tax=Steinernema carpocapsae TaxID=34508 RepID=A0A4U5NDF1_STECR|nr:hypothetical protein L596_014930 [Steinernema carpocapsae]
MLREPIFLLFVLFGYGNTKAIDLQDVNQLLPFPLNYCNDSSLFVESGLQKSSLGQFLGYPCSPEFYHCRWQSEGFVTFKKLCSTGLVYDTSGTQSCNYDYNVAGCAMKTSANACKKTQFSCPFSENCVAMAQRCDGHYDCLLEEDEQNCPMCAAGEFACVVSEQCIGMSLRCNGIAECNDGTDEMNCEQCGNGGFYCAKSGECVRGNQRCDGTPQCASGDDEILCKLPMLEKLYTCEDRLETVPMKNVCDGNADCRDGSDERYCTKPSDPSVLSFSSHSSSSLYKRTDHFPEDLPYSLPPAEKPVFPVVPSASLPIQAPQTPRSVIHRPVTPHHPILSEQPTSSESSSTYSSYSNPEGVPDNKHRRSGLTNNVQTPTVEDIMEHSYSSKEETSYGGVEPAFPLKIPSAMTSRHGFDRTRPAHPPPPTTQKTALLTVRSTPFSPPIAKTTRRPISTVPPRPKTEDIPAYTGHSGRKTFFGDGISSMLTTKAPRVVVEVTSRPPTTPKPGTEDDDIVRRISEQLAKSNKKSARWGRTWNIF